MVEPLVELGWGPGLEVRFFFLGPEGGMNALLVF